MTSPENYLLRVREFLTSLSVVLTAEEQSEVWHLIDHGEPAEGLRTLAWIVVDGEKRLLRSEINSIRELTSGLVDESDFPTNLDAFAAD